MNKLEYILHQFARTKNKKYENYCIERIYNKLDNPNLKFVTQQMFRRSDGKIALADLYFPQLKMSVEIDEQHHENQAEEDQIRTQEILSKIKKLETVIPFEPAEERIDVGKSETLESIHQQIDEVVLKIQERIAQLPKLEWKSDYRSTEELIQQKIIKDDEGAAFRTLWDVSNLFNKKYKEGSQNCFFAANVSRNIWVWCPKLKLEDMNVKVPYNNEISSDGKTIYESAQNNNDEFVKKYLSQEKMTEIRYVFPYYKTGSGEYAYVFKGVYKLNVDKTKAMDKRVWEKEENSDIDISIYHDVQPHRENFQSDL